jgi:hypothetical protein
MNVKNLFKNFDVEAEKEIYIKWMFLILAAFFILLVTILISGSLPDNWNVELLRDLGPKLMLWTPPVLFIGAYEVMRHEKGKIGGSSVTKKNVSGNFLYMLLSVFIGIPFLILFWFVAYILNQDFSHAIWNYGVLTIFQATGFTWIMAGIIFPLEWTKIGKNIGGRIIISLNLPLFIWVLTADRAIEMGASMWFVSLFVFILGLVILISGWLITQSLVDRKETNLSIKIRE